MTATLECPRATFYLLDRIMKKSEENLKDFSKLKTGFQALEIDGNLTRKGRRRSISTGDVNFSPYLNKKIWEKIYDRKPYFLGEWTISDRKKKFRN